MDARSVEARPERDGGTRMTVAALARLSGLTPDTVRYYERVGLLPPPPRSATGYRKFGADALDRLCFIQGAQRLGLRLREIRELLSVRDSGTCPCGDAAVLLRQRMAEIGTEIAELTRLYDALNTMIEQIPSPDCPNPVPGVWKPPVSSPA